MSNTVKVSEITGIYQVLDWIAIGGQAAIVLAKDTKTGQTVVLKQLLVTPQDSGYDEQRKRFEREGSIRINHPGVLDPIEYFEDCGRCFIVLPFIDGQDLAGLLAAYGGKLAVDQVTIILAVLADALVAIHAAGYIHRDIKVQNILISKDGRVYLCDMGICRNTREHTIVTTTGLLGSLLWMAPEQVDPPYDVDIRSDLYSLGVVLYNMLTGQMPVQGNTPDEIQESIRNQIPSSPRQLDSSIPPSLDAICMRLLAKAKQDRYQTAQELVQALNPSAGKTPSLPACVSCGRPLAAASRFCQGCGAPFGQMAGGVFCLACGAQVGHVASCPACSRTFGTVDHQLRGSLGALSGRIYRIPQGDYEVGRDQILPRDQHISRRHMRISCLNGQVCLDDAGSANKTLVNGRPITHRTILGPGCVVGIAGNVLIYFQN